MTNRSKRNEKTIANSVGISRNNFDFFLCSSITPLTRISSFLYSFASITRSFCTILVLLFKFIQFFLSLTSSAYVSFFFVIYFFSPLRFVHCRCGRKKIIEEYFTSLKGFDWRVFRNGVKDCREVFEKCFFKSNRYENSRKLCLFSFYPFVTVK